MPFITQGKTNWKFLLIVIILAVIVGGGALWYAKKPEQPYQPVVIQKTEKNKITLSSSIKGCAESDRGMATTYGEEKEQEPKIEVTGNEIDYSRAINHTCCRKVDMQKEITGSSINIFEVWSGSGCYCMCFSNIGAKLTNIPVGHYTVNVYEKGTQPGGNNEPMEQKLIISQSVDTKLTEDETANCIKKYPLVEFKDCVPGKIVDEWSGIVLYPNTLDTSNITHYIDAPVPDVVKQAGIASYITSSSTCQTTWSIKINDAWKEVNQLDFCNFIIEYNNSCNKCLLEWKEGCC
jgi:hypothetical protein